MPDVKWSIKGRQFTNCNCAYGCPCQFNALPSRGFCQGMGVVDVSEGHYGDTKLDGLKAAAIFTWPGPIHLGHGKCVFVVDERAKPAQRQALLRIIGGEDTEMGTTIFNIMKLMTETTYDPIFAPIEIEIDKDARTARLSIKGVVDCRVEPILNPVTGAQHRVQIGQGPGSFEYDVAEIARGWTRTSGAPVTLELSDTHAHLTDMHYTQSGIVRAA